MNGEQNYFGALMKQYGFEVVNEKFMDFLNASLKKQKLTIYFFVEPFDGYKFLEKQILSTTAFMLDGNWVKIEKLGLVKLAGDGQTASDRLGIVSISLDDEVFYPAVNEYNPLPVAHPSNPKIQIVNHPNYRGDVYLPGDLIAFLDKFFLSEKDFKSFNYYQKQKQLSKKPNQRLAALKYFLEAKGYEPSKNKLIKGQHIYLSRQQLWDELSLFEPQLFPHRGKETIDKFFNGNPYISIK